MNLHNYTKYAHHQVYTMIVAILTFYLFYLTYMKSINAVEDGFRYAMFAIISGLTLLSSINALISVRFIKKINKIKKNDLDRKINKIIVSIKENEDDIKKNKEKIVSMIYHEFYLNSENIYNINEVRNLENRCLEIIIQPILYESFWISMELFEIHISIDDENINVSYLSNKSFFQDRVSPDLVNNNFLF